MSSVLLMDADINSVGSLVQMCDVTSGRGQMFVGV